MLAEQPYHGISCISFNTRAFKWPKCIFTLIIHITVVCCVLTFVFVHENSQNTNIPDNKESIYAYLGGTYEVLVRPHEFR